MTWTGPRAAASLVLASALLLPGCNGLTPRDPRPADAPPAMAQPAPSSRPNLVVVLSDDHRWDALGAAGNPAVITPVMDRLARDGVHFRQASRVDLTHLGARRVAARGVTEDAADVLEREAQVARVTDEAQPPQVLGGVTPVIVGAVALRMQQADVRVVAHGIGRGAGGARQLHDGIHGNDSPCGPGPRQHPTGG